MGCGCGGANSRVATVARTTNTQTSPPQMYTDDGTLWELVSHPQPDGHVVVQQVPGLQRALAEFYRDTQYWAGMNPVEPNSTPPGPAPDATMVPAQPSAV